MIGMIIIVILAAVIILLGAATAYFFNVAFVTDRERIMKNPSVWEEATPEDKIKESPSVAPYLQTMREEAKRIRELSPEKWETVSFDGVPLSARFVKADNMRGIVLMMHGFRSNPLHDMACAVRYFNSLGFGCLLPWQRAHGESGGKYLYYGTREKYDVKAWAELLLQKYPDLPVILDGVSMGATSVLMASGLDLPSNVKGIIGDCGFTSPEEIFKSVMKNIFHLPYFPLLHITSSAAKIIMKIDLKESVTDAVKKNKLPVIIAHGQDDGLVPYSMGAEIYEAVKQSGALSWFVSVPKADHGLSYMVAPDVYKRAINELFDICIK